MPKSTEDYLDSLLARAMGEAPVEEDNPADNIDEQPMGAPTVDEQPMEAPTVDEQSIEVPTAAEPPVPEQPVPEQPAADVPMDEMEVPATEQSVDEQPIEEASSGETIEPVLDEPEAELPADELKEDTPADEPKEDTPAEDDTQYADEEIDSLLDSIGALDESFSPKEEEPADEADASEATGDSGTDDLSDSMSDLASDFGGLDPASDDLSALLDDITKDSGSDESASNADDLGLGDLLAGMGESDSDLSDIGNLLDMDENSEIVDGDSEFASSLLGDGDADNFDIDSLLDEDEEGLSKKERKKRKKELKAKRKAEGASESKKTGFIAKIISFLFDEDEEEDEAGGKLIEQTAVDLAAEGAAENEAILNELGDGENSSAPAEAPKKKKDKKEKKKKDKKKGDSKGEKAGGKKKEKKVKEKKEAEPLPPLKKLPIKKVIVVAVFAASIAAMMIFATMFVPYTQDIEEAKKHYATGNYMKCYEYLVGHDLSEEDALLYSKTVIILKVQRQIDSYRNYMKLHMKPEALNALVQGVDAMDKYAEEANTLGIMNEYAQVSSTLVNELEVSFGVSVDMAREWILMEGTKEYTKTIYDFIGVRPKDQLSDDEEDASMQVNDDIQILIQEENEDNQDAI